MIQALKRDFKVLGAFYEVTFDLRKLSVSNAAATARVLETSLLAFVETQQSQPTASSPSGVDWVTGPRSAWSNTQPASAGQR